jgi:hypothetical protein
MKKFSFKEIVKYIGKPVRDLSTNDLIQILSKKEDSEGNYLCSSFNKPAAFSYYGYIHKKYLERNKGI